MAVNHPFYCARSYGIANAVWRPPWQLGVSMSLMIITFIFTIYVAARIYRVGILMYGKKASYKELVKWFFYKE